MMCKVCLVDKPVEAFPRNVRMRSGYSNWCRPCTAAYSRAWRAAHREQSRASGAKWRAANPEAQKLADERWKRANPERVKAARQARYAHNPGPRRAAAKRWTAANPERKAANDAAWKAANPEKSRAAWRKYGATHPERQQRSNAARRARLKGAPVNDLTTVQWRWVLFAYDYRCAYCNASDVLLTQDHVVPLCRGGSHTASNVVPACEPCNYGKGTKLVEEWASVR